VSSEIGYDFLKFYIDDIEMASWSGEVAWERSTYLLTEGSHILKWAYSKDGTFSSGEDCAWLDFIVFPIFDFAASFSADETEICEGESISFTDESYGEPITWDWTFEGGTPPTSTLQNPVVEYFNSGTYDVSLTVSDGTDIVTLTKEDYITVSTIPGIPQTPTGPTSVCADEEYSIYTTTGIGGVSEYVWILDPPEAGTTSGTSLENTVNWEPVYLGEATLKVAAINSCGIGEYSDLLTITRYLPEVSLEPFEMVCLNWPEFELSGGWPEGGEYSGAGIENGWFDPATAGLGTHTIIYTYIDPNNCENFAEETILVDPCTGIGENNLGSEIQVYPIPGKGTFSIRFKQASDNVNLEIFNSLNRSVYEVNGQSITDDLIYYLHLHYLPSGIYYLQVSGENVYQVKKIIIQD
jgi:PKD repeat protein